MANSSDVTAGDTILASHYNNLRKDFSSGASFVNRNSNFTVAEATDTAIQWSADIFTPRYSQEGESAAYWVSGANTRFTAPQTGLYLLGCILSPIDVTADCNLVRVKARLNGSTVLTGGDMQCNPQTNKEGMNITFPYVLSATNYIEWLIYQTQSTGSDAETFDDMQAFMVRLAY